jgi:hypothetical protein
MHRLASNPLRESRKQGGCYVRTTPRRGAPLHAAIADTFDEFPAARFKSEGPEEGGYWGLGNPRGPMNSASDVEGFIYIDKLGADTWFRSRLTRESTS